MDVTTLQERVRAALKEGEFSISGATLESPPMTQLFTAFLGSDDLALTGASITSEDASGIVIGGSMTFLGLTDLAASAAFTIATDVAQVRIALTGVPAGWKLSTSFPPLAASVLDAFSWSGVTLVLDTQSAPLPADFPAGYGFSAYTQSISETLVYGLSLEAIVTVSGSLDAAEALLGGNSWSVSGPIAYPAATPSILLVSEPQPSVSLAGYDMPFRLELVAAAVETTAGVVSSSLIQYHAEVQKDLGAGGIVVINVAGRQSMEKESVLEFEGTPAGVVPLSEALLGAFLNGESVSGQDQIPADFPSLDEVDLDSIRLSLAFEAKTPAVISAGVTIGIGDNESWPVIGDLIRFRGLRVSFDWVSGGYTSPGGKNLSIVTSLTAIAEISGGEVDAEMVLPDQTFTLSLAEGQSIDLTAFVKDSLGDAMIDAAIVCDGLLISGSRTTGAYSFHLELSSTWPLQLGSTTLVFRDVVLDLSKTPSLAGAIAITTEVAGVPVTGGAEYSDADGWTLHLGTEGPQKIPLNDLASSIVELFGGEALPDNAPSFFLTGISIAYRTKTKDYVFLCSTEMDIQSTAVGLGIRIQRGEFFGYLWVAGSYFEIDFTTANQKTTILATWRDDTPLGIQSLFETFGIGDSIEIPEGLDIDLKAASLKYESDTGNLVITGESANYGKAVFLRRTILNVPRWFFGIAVGKRISFSDLPMIGTTLGDSQTAAIDNFTLLVASQPITVQELVEFNPFIPGDYPQVPATGMAVRFGIAGTMLVAGTKIPLTVGVPNPTAPAAASTANSTGVQPATGANPQSVPPPVPAAADGTVWFDLQKPVGPVTFDRIGIRYLEKRLWFLLEASLQASGVTISLLGLTISSPLDSFDPEVELLGLGLGYKTPTLEISGSLAKVVPTPAGMDFQYRGSAVVKAASFGLGAIASYARLSTGEPSLFVYAQLTGTFGGPPVLFLTGVLAGMGYNSAVRIPTKDEVFLFPLVTGLTGQQIPPNTPPEDALRILTAGTNPWVKPAVGQTWLAIGIQFNSFKLVDSTALLLAQFGNEFSLALLGLSTARFPQDTALPAYAQVQLQLEALLQPSRGFFGISANLTRNSFLISPTCVLTGGFAFYVWFGDNEHAGDFVITLGGYNPNFQIPAWYPREARLGFTWTVDTRVTIIGNAYFALTPSAVMAGGYLSVSFVDGNLRAWLTVYADFLIRWNPFAFAIELGVSIGASYKMNLLFTTATVTIELAAKLKLLGPPTRGSAYVKWWVISFTVTFGPEDEPEESDKLDWTQFTGMLPDPAAAVKFVPVDGLISTRDAADDTEIWLLRNDRFVFTATSAIPATKLYVGDDLLIEKDKIAIRPMAASDLEVKQKLTLTGGTLAGWTVTPITENVPAAMWGQGSGDNVPPPDGQLVRDQLTGYSLTAPEPALGATAGSIDVARDLQFSPVLPDGVLPAIDGPQGPLATEANTVAIIQNELNAQPQIDARTALAAQLETLLGIDVPNGSLAETARVAVYLYADEPRLVPRSS